MFANCVIYFDKIDFFGFTIIDVDSLCYSEHSAVIASVIVPTTAEIGLLEITIWTS